MKILNKQIWHFLSLFVLLFSVNHIISSANKIYEGSLWNVNSQLWLYLSIIFAIIHQTYVLVCWRYELFYKGISKFFGNNSFKYYKVGFAILIISRPVFIILLSISNSMTIDIGNTISYLASFFLIIPAIYGIYSVFKYFGINKALPFEQAGGHTKSEYFDKQTWIRISKVHNCTLETCPGALGRRSSERRLRSSVR